MKTLALFFALVLPAAARLRENPEQCLVRYGKPTLESEDGNTKWYKKNGISIYIQFRYQVAVSIQFSRTPTGLMDLLSKLSDEQIQSLLDANAVGGPWKEKEWPKGHETDGIFGKLFTRGDDKAEARWDYATGHLTITTAAEIALREKEAEALLEKENQTRKQSATQSTKGF